MLIAAGQPCGSADVKIGLYQDSQDCEEPVNQEHSQGFWD